jgi:PPOX class probable F420-dependent enzyme
MATPPVPAEIEAFLRAANPAVIATLSEDGSPHTVATWYLWDEGRVLVNMDRARKRLAHLRRDPRASLTVLGADGWQRHVTLEGRAVSIEPDLELEDIDRLARHYTASPFGTRDRARVSAWIEVDSWHAWAGARAWGGSD